MSLGVRKPNSKWDMKEESHLPRRIMEENDWPESRDDLFSDRKSRAWHPEAADGSSRSKWSSTDRGSRRSDVIHEYRSRTLNSVNRFEGDDSYGARISPGPEEWRMQSRHHSGKDDWRRPRRSRSWSLSRSWSRDRSRSRSPVRGFRRDSGEYDKHKGRSGTSSQLCRNFASGRCRRGDQCWFLHQNAPSHGDRFDGHQNNVSLKYSARHVTCEVDGDRSDDWRDDSLEGNRRGTSRRLSHPDSDASGMRELNEPVRESDNRSRDVSMERHGECESCRSSEVLCKFFAVGRCRNGKNCRFTHDQAHSSPSRRSDDKDLPSVHTANDPEKSLNGPKWSEPNNFSSTINRSGEKNRKLCSSESTPGWAMNDDKTIMGSLTSRKVVEIGRKKSLQGNPDGFGDGIHVREETAAKNQLEDVEMSPEWNYRVSSSHTVDKREQHSFIPISEAIMNRGVQGAGMPPPVMNQVSPVPQNYNLMESVVTSALPPGEVTVLGSTPNLRDSAVNLTAAQDFNRNGFPSNSLPGPQLNDAGQIKHTVAANSSAVGVPVTLQQAVPLEEKSVNQLDVRDAFAYQLSSGTPTSQNVVSSEQLSQLTNISNTLVQLLANEQKLSQFSTAQSPLNGKGVSAFGGLYASAKPDSSVGIQGNQPLGNRPSDLRDNVECQKLSNPDIYSQLTTVGKTEAIGQNSSTSALGRPTNDSISNNMSSTERKLTDRDCQQIKQELHMNSEVTKEDKKLKESAKDLRDVKVSKDKRVKVEKSGYDNDPPEFTAEDEKGDESKKGKDAKALRPFKFALAEFVKELLKPKWKEGQVSKDSYKVIVKKVVDKVSGTLQGASIPQTQEKIDQYLSASKPKLSKLVQAYVEKFQKEK